RTAGGGRPDAHLDLRAPGPGGRRHPRPADLAAVDVPPGVGKIPRISWIGAGGVPIFPLAPDAEETMDVCNLLIIDADPNIRKILGDLLAGRQDIHLLSAGSGP